MYLLLCIVDHVGFLLVYVIKIVYILVE